MSSENQSYIVIDDDEVFNQTLCRALKRKDKTAFTALNSEQAFALASEKMPDCAVLDLSLGDENGIELIEPLLAIHPELKIVVLTGYASLATAVQAIKLGAWNYLAKPVDVGAIVKAFGQPSEADIEPDVSSPISLKNLEWEHLQRVLADNDGNVTVTARQLGMHRRTLQRKLKKKNTNTNDS